MGKVILLTQNPHLPMAKDQTLGDMMKQKGKAESWAEGYVCANLDIQRFKKQHGRFPTEEEFKFMRDEVYPPTPKNEKNKSQQD